MTTTSTLPAPTTRPEARPRREGQTIVRAQGLTKKFGQFTAVDSIDFEVRRGEVFGFLGPNGSGKSTTIGMMLGLVTPTSGSIDLFDMGPDRRSEALGHVGAIIETPAFYPYLSGRENLRAMGQLRGGISKQRVDDVLGIVGLSQAADRPFKNYSLGMKQRLGIGWTLLHDPEFLVLDEPTNGLDPAGMAEIRRLILQLARDGKTIFLSSHLLNEVEQVCDRVVIIQRGTIIAQGMVDELVHGGDRLRIRARQVDEARRIIQQLNGGVTLDITDDGAILLDGEAIDPAAVNRALVQGGVEVEELRMLGASLEQVFLELTGDGAQPTA